MLYSLTLISVSVADASPTKMFTYEAPNKINAELILSWTNPEGNYSGFKITGDYIPEETLTRTCNPNCSHTISGLKHYSMYNLNLKVLSCGLPSTPVSLSCKTGITSRTLFFVDNKITAFNF